MTRSCLSMPLLAIAIGFLLPGFASCQSAPTKREIRLKQDALDVPEGATVQVDFIQGRSLYGRLSNVSDQGFLLQYLDNGSIQERAIGYAEVKRLFRSRAGGAVPRKTMVIVTLVGVAAFVGIVAGVFATHHRPM